MATQLVQQPGKAKEIVKLSLQGLSKMAIAEEMGHDRATISRAMQTTKVRDLIEKTYNQIAELSPHVFNTYSDELTREVKDIDDRKLRFAVANQVAGITGISPVRDSRSSFFLTNILNPTTIHLSPVVGQALERLGIGQGDVVDATYDDEGNDE